MIKKQSILKQRSILIYIYVIYVIINSILKCLKLNIILFENLSTIIFMIILIESWLGSRTRDNNWEKM